MLRRGFLRSLIGLFMTTIHHSPVTVGAAANAGTLNGPLSQLDAAIELVDDRISTIIAASGTSDTEVVDARDGFTVVLDRMQSAYLTGNTLLVDPTFAVSSSSAKRHKTIALAMAAAVAGDTIMLAPGTYAEDVTIAAHGVKIVGSGAAGYNVSGSTFNTGSVIAGSININNKKHAVIADLTIDVRASVKDGIYGGTQADSGVPLYTDIRNVVLVGHGGYSACHGILLESGGYNSIHNVKIYSFAHGIALRCALTNVNQAYVEGCGVSSIIIKGANVTGSAYGININNCIFALGGGLFIEGYDTGTYANDINVSNCYAHGPIVPAFRTQQVSGGVLNVTFSNCSSFAATGNAFQFDYGDRISCVNCRSNVALIGFSNGSATRVQLINCFALNSVTSATAGAFIEHAVNGRAARSTIAKVNSTNSIANSAWVQVASMVAVTTSQYVAADELTAQATGTYRIRARGVFAYNTTGTRAVRFYNASTATAYGDTVLPAFASGNPTIVDAVNIVALNAGHVIEFQAFQNSGGALNLTTDSYFELELIEAS